jgi:hypothetical protein
MITTKQQLPTSAKSDGSENKPLLTVRNLVALIVAGVLLVAVSVPAAYFHLREEDGTATANLDGTKTTASKRISQSTLPPVSVQTKSLLRPFSLASFVVARPMLSGLIGTLVLVVVGGVVGIVVWQTTPAQVTDSPSPSTPDLEHQKDVNGGGGGGGGATNVATKADQPWKIPVIVVGSVVFVGLVVGGVFLVRHLRSTKGTTLPGPGTNPLGGPGNNPPGPGPQVSVTGQSVLLGGPDPQVPQIVVVKKEPQALTDLKIKHSKVQAALKQYRKRYFEIYNIPSVLFFMSNASPIDITIDSATTDYFDEQCPVYIKFENEVFSTGNGSYFTENLSGTIVRLNLDVIDDDGRMKFVGLIDGYLDVVLARTEEELQKLG